MINITPNSIKANKNMISDLETKIGFKMPPGYIKFLLNYNGGVPEPNILEIKESFVKSLSVNSFFGVGVDSINNIITQYEQFVGRIPKECIPVARVEGGDIMCISLGSLRYGKVFLWEHEKEFDDYNSIQIEDLKLLADSFDKLLNRILPYQVKDVDSVGYEVKSVWIDPDFLKELDKDNK